MSGTPQRNPTHQQPHHADDSSTPHAHVVPSSHYGHPTLPPSTPLTHPTNNTPPQTEWKRGRPKQARPLPSPALTPIPSSTPSVPRRVRTSQIVHKYVEHVARAPPVPPPPPIPTCNVCYSTDIRLYTAPEIEERRANPVEPAMRVARAYGLPFGNFMMKLLDPSKTYILNQTATATQLGRFLKGRAVVTPVDMVEAMRVHPYSVPHATNGSVIHPSTTNAPSSSVPPSSSAAYCHNPTPNNHGSDGPEPREADDEDGVGGPDDGGTSSPFAFHALDEWAAHRTRVRVQREVRSLATLEMLRAVTTQETLSWSALLSFSIAPISAAILQAAPVLWSIMTAAAVPKSATNGRIEGDHSEGWPTDSKGRRKTTRDPWLGCVFAILLLLFFHNNRCNIFQSLLGVLLFSCNSNRLVYSILGRLGITVSHTTTVSRLHSLASSATDTIRGIGDLALSDTDARFFAILYDNINQRIKAWRPKLGAKDTVESGTAATIVILEDVPDNAFDPADFHRRRSAGERRHLTTRKLRQLVQAGDDHLSDITMASVIRILTTHVPSLRQHSSFVHHLYSVRFAKERLPPGRKTQVHPLATSNFNEALTSGNKAVLHDIVIDQMKLDPTSFDRRLIPVCRDQMTIARLRSLRLQTAKDLTPFDRHEWVLPIPQLWHMKWANLKVVFKCHWSPTFGHGVYGMHHDADALGRKLNPDKCDFYPSHRFVETRFKAMVLHAVRLVCREGMPEGICLPPRSLTMTEELEWHFGPDGHLKNVGEDGLETLGRRIARRFICAAAADECQGLAIRPRPDTIYGQSGIRAFPLPDDAISEPPGIDVEAGDEIEDVLELEDFFASGQVEDEDDDDPISLAVRTDAQWEGDHVLQNVVRSMADMCTYLEFHRAITDGDIGAAFEMIKRLLFQFWGAGSTNYGRELLHLMCSVLYEWSEELRKAIFMNWLVNPSGLPGHFHELDLLQEHLNFWLKLFNAKTIGFDSAFMKEAISLNIHTFGHLRSELPTIFGLARVGHGRSDEQLEADFNTLGHHYLWEHVFSFVPGRSQPYSARDAFSEGQSKLANGTLDDFLSNTTPVM